MYANIELQKVCRKKNLRNFVGYIELTLVEKLNSGWSGGQAEVSFAKRHPEVTLVNISAVLDLAPTVTYNNHALPMYRIGQR